MLRSLIFLFVVLVAFCSTSVSAGNKRALTNGIGMKPYPLIGRHDDSRETYLATLPPNERNQTENLMFKFKEVNIKANDGITLKAIVYDPAPWQEPCCCLHLVMGCEQMGICYSW